jgi:hypothetical protein
MAKIFRKSTSMTVCLFFMMLSSIAHAFTYSEVYLCAKKFPSGPSWTWDTADIFPYWLHFGDKGELIVWNDGYQWSSEGVKNYDNLYNQVGRKTLLKIKSRLDSVIKFDMIDVSTGWKKTVIFDRSDLTYLSKNTTPNTNYPTLYGTCVREFPN